MNHLTRNRSSSSRRGPGVPVAGAPAAPVDGSTPASGNPNPATVSAAASQPLPSFQDTGFPSWWSSSSLMGSSEGLHPPGEFTSLLQSNTSPDNFHLVGNTRSTPTASPTDECNAECKETIDVDEDELIEDGRTERRLNWTKDEDIRSASAWVHNSKDPVDGTDRKSDQYWADVTKEYNKSTEICRRRNRNQLKIRWDRVKKPVGDFHGCWVRINGVYRSGFSDDQLKELAEKMYASEHKDKDFTLNHIWKVVQDQRKWSAYVKKMEKEKEKKKEGATKKRAEVVNLEDNPNICPPGHKKAKDEQFRKKKTPQQSLFTEFQVCNVTVQIHSSTSITITIWLCSCL